MTHTFLPGEDLLLLSARENPEGYEHLDRTGGRLVLIADVFYQDIRRACGRLMVLLKEGRVKPKNIAFGDER